MLYKLLAFVIFIFSVFLHEFIHYSFAKHFGANAHFEWLHLKEKFPKSFIAKYIGPFGFCPSMYIEKEKFTLHEYRWILLSPFPVGVIMYFLILFTFFFPQFIEKSHLSQVFLLSVILVFAFATAYLSSLGDIKDYKEF